MAMSSKTTEVRVARIEERLRIRLHLPAILPILACTVNRTSLGQAAGDSLVTRFTRAVFNRLDAEPGVTQRHSKNPPVSPLRKGGKKTRRRRLSPPCEGGVGGVRAAAHAMHLKTALRLSNLAFRMAAPRRDTRRCAEPGRPGNRSRCAPLSRGRTPQIFQFRTSDYEKGTIDLRRTVRSRRCPRWRGPPLAQLRLGAADHPPAPPAAASPSVPAHHRDPDPHGATRQGHALRHHPVES